MNARSLRPRGCGYGSIAIRRSSLSASAARAGARLGFAWLLAALLGCGAANEESEPAARPAAPVAYPGRCDFLGIEMTEAPAEKAAGADNASLAENASLQVIATYRPGGSPKAAPFGLSFRVQRDRVADLRAHLEQHPTVLCRPEATGAGGYQAQVPPFEGQTGEPTSK